MADAIAWRHLAVDYNTDRGILIPKTLFNGHRNLNLGRINRQVSDGLTSTVAKADVLQALQGLFGITNEDLADRFVDLAN